MCGDGANDLLALKEADLSLGIQKSDASYAANFAISSLLDVDEVIRESKNNVSNISQFFFYIFIGYIFSKISRIYFLASSAYLSSSALIYFNFTSILIFPFFISLSKPAEKPTKEVPVPNLMTLHSHLVIWGNVIITNLLLIIYFSIFGHSEEF